jgi:hypothetical protein
MWEQVLAMSRAFSMAAGVRMTDGITLEETAGI